MKITISDVFFNSKEIESLDDCFDCKAIKEKADEFLFNYPCFREYFTAEELARDFEKRL